MQLQIPQPDFEGMLILTQTATPPVNPETNSVILDLDVFKQEESMIPDEELWDSLEILRHRKNKFFEGCITDKTRQLFGRREEYWYACSLSPYNLSSNDRNLPDNWSE